MQQSLSNLVSVASLAIFLWPGTAITETTPHWSLEPIARPTLPEVQNYFWAVNGVDRFVLAQLEAEGLSPSSRASRDMLIRRATFDLTGLPPTFESVQEFVTDPAPDAYARLVDRLLASPRYGERWGRHWLDIARYADTRGHTFDSREKRFPYSYTYRDYVIGAFNGNLPYDRFILEQLAADLLVLETDGDRRALAALGFLTLGRRFLMNEQDTIDDRVDVVTRGLMGLTVSCARCHDHKFDPIPTDDYYSLYGVFASCLEPERRPLLAQPEKTEQYRTFRAEYEKRWKDREDFMHEKHQELLGELRSHVGDYLVRVVKEQDEGKKLVKADATVLVTPDDVRLPVVNRWREFLRSTANGGDPIFGPWHRLAELSPGQFSLAASEVMATFKTPPQGGEGNPRVLEALTAGRLQSIEDMARRYGTLFSEVALKWQHLRTQDPSATRLPDEHEEALRQVLVGPGTPTALTLKEAVPMLHHGHIVRIRQLTGAIERCEIDLVGAPPRAMALTDAPMSVDPVVFQRGDPLRPGKKVPRRFLRMLSPGGAVNFGAGSGRLELARAIASPENPLTARVLVNWVWLHHFGKGLVTTPGNFGRLGVPPSHPKLLDYLAAIFIEEGWSIKHLHRQIMLSSTYQQVSSPNQLYAQRDPENRLLWRMNRRRLEFESLRDSVIAVSGQADDVMGGKSFQLLGHPFSRRRTVYTFLDRENLPTVMRTFDFAAPESPNHQRSRTTVPQQALFLMNSPFLIEHARHLAARALAISDTSPGRIAALFQFVYATDPTDGELEMMQEFVENQDTSGSSTATLPASQEDSQKHLTGWESLAQVLLLSNRFMFVD